MREGEKIDLTNPTALRPYFVTALIIIGVVSLGLLAVNQFLDFRFKAQLLGSPCNVCKELNPHLESCFKEASNIVVNKVTGEIVENPYVINLTDLEIIK
jgi:hypothetical protein|tara:strand:- start:4845 stop:5141 length:297 start_codon:yes stop_codon:yes gene_type:complete